MKTILKRDVSSQGMTIQFVKKIYEDFLKPAGSFTLFLEGGLGAGKTFITRELLRLCGVEQEIVSPTYTYLQEYQTFEKTYLHFDLYRMTSEAFVARGFLDTIAAPNICCIVEWPQKIKTELHQFFPEKRFTIVIQHGVGASNRVLKFLVEGVGGGSENTEFFAKKK